MLDARRPKGRLFYWLFSVLWAWSMATPPTAAADGPATTHISDTVFRADGNPATGWVLISWPAFTTTDSKPVAAGTKNVQLGQGGVFDVDLVPNAGGSPAGTYYTAVFQLDDAVRTEYWVVGSVSPTTIAAVRTTPGSGISTAMVSRQYVDAAVSSKASDASVVHLSGPELIAGSKSFSVPPSVPAPAASTDAVNKAYVDQAVAAVGAGSYVAKSGDTMSGPLSLPGDAAAVNGLNITLDQQLINDIKALVQAIEQYAKTAGLPKPVSK